MAVQEFMGRYGPFEGPQNPALRASAKARTTKPVKPPVPMTFEEAMQYLRRGRAIQRRAWHVESMIFALGNKVFLKLPNKAGFMQDPPVNNVDYGSAPTYWRPYPQDFLADDWRIVK